MPELRVIDRRLSLCIESQSMKPRQVRSKLNAHPKTSIFTVVISALVAVATRR